MNLRETFRTQFLSQHPHLQHPHPCLRPLSHALRALDVEYASPGASTTSCPALPLPSLISPRNNGPCLPSLTMNLYHHPLLHLSLSLSLSLSRYHRRHQRRHLPLTQHPTNSACSAGTSDALRMIQSLKIPLTRYATPQHSPRRIRCPLRTQRQRNPGMPHLPTRSLRS